MPLTGEYKPSTSDWARTQAEKFEASRMPKFLGVMKNVHYESIFDPAQD